MLDYSLGFRSQPSAASHPIFHPMKNREVAGGPTRSVPAGCPKLKSNLGFYCNPRVAGVTRACAPFLIGYRQKNRWVPVSSAVIIIIIIIVIVIVIVIIIIIISFHTTPWFVGV